MSDFDWPQSEAKYDVAVLRDVQVTMRDGVELAADVYRPVLDGELAPGPFPAVLIRTPPLAEVDERHWDLIMEANLKGLFLCCKHSIPAMLKSGGGSIVNISSVSGLRGQGYSLPYAVSKAGVIHLTTVAANQYTSLGIRVNAIAPGPVDTPQFRGSTASAEAFKEREAQHPMGRVGDPGEIADAILFLASDEASFISGSTLLVDGGTMAVL